MNFFFIKLILIFFLSFTFAAASYGQTNVYHPFPDSNAVWGMKWGEVCSSQPPFYHQCLSVYQYRVNADTIISGIKYSRIFKDENRESCAFINGNYACTNPVYSSLYFGAIRNDHAGRKVYFIDRYDSLEKKLYDFTLVAGDTVNTGYCMGVITSVDSMLVAGNYRKTYILDNNLSNIIIEGIGNVNTNFGGPFEGCQPCVCPFFWGFSCFMENGKPVYGDSSCAVITSTQNLPITMPEFVVYPNPLSPGSVIQIPSGMKIRSIMIFNSIGVKVRSGHDFYSGQIPLSSHDFSPGLYYYILMDDVGRGYGGRFVVKID